MSKIILLALIVLLTSCSTTPSKRVSSSQPWSAQEIADRREIERGAQMAQIDFDSAHPALLKLCLSKFPKNYSKLNADLEAWGHENIPAQLEMQQIMKTQNKVSDKVIAVQFKRVTDIYIQSLMSLDDSKLEKACDGDYVTGNLNIPIMQFKKLLVKVKSSRDYQR
jgi:hypothetical protein